MKKIKSISLFFVIGMLSFGLGIMAMYLYGYYFANSFFDNQIDNAVITNDEILENVAVSYDRLSADTEVIVLEYDLNSKDTIEEVVQLPAKYLGMNRKNFLEAMRQYEISPPLTEREKGFKGIEVLAFSSDKVILKKLYRQIGPSDGCYLALNQNEIVVLLKDRKTIYLKTGLKIENFPQEIRNKILDMLYFENEDSLFSFLENYTS